MYIAAIVSLGYTIMSINYYYKKQQHRQCQTNKETKIIIIINIIIILLLLDYQKRILQVVIAH